MRTNPLIGPLVVLLCLPFAVGIADTVSFAPGSGTPPVAKPACLSCDLDTTVINKEKSVLDYACGLSSKNGTPYAILEGKCQRYRCNSAYYYTWSGWSATNRCSDHQFDSTACPEGSCTPP